MMAVRQASRARRVEWKNVDVAIIGLRQARSAAQAPP
jgi:hypothetical protein